MEKNSKLLPIAIIVSAILISGTLLFSTFPGRYKAVGNRVFDTFKGMYVDPGRIDYMPKETTPTQISKSTPRKTADISKVIIIGSSMVKESRNIKIYCAIQNNDEVEQLVNVNFIYYDKNKKPIFAKTKEWVRIKPGDIQGVTMDEYGDVDNIDSYEIKIVDTISWD
jgi:hypothetical protein